ncbi:hypothetical protein BA190_09470 [Labrys sp. WJW]|uniref:hypothetical protein n=1 Tax=Labrys sp. WJW TaxID=1737983 RepID=UPI00082C7F8A|nr:hypothetical protein [Labrys sp. WJW]OCC05135.1 hypothetical protein BA190_09470 [Labrys sp. WJW]
MSYRTEFPDFDPATLPAIPAHWVDQSWHNDMCPSWAAGLATVFVDHVQPEKRDIPDLPRFSVMVGEAEAYSGDDWQAVLAAVDTANADVYSFEEFQQTAEAVDDVEAFIGEAYYPMKLAGNVYMAKLYIVKEKDGGWLLDIGNTEFHASPDDLPTLEAELYNFAVREGYCGRA